MDQDYKKKKKGIIKEVTYLAKRYAKHEVVRQLSAYLAARVSEASWFVKIQ